MKMIILYIVSLVWTLWLPLYLYPDKIDVRLDNSDYITRLIYNTENYDICGLYTYDTKKNLNHMDFSMEFGPFIAGRLAVSGLWRELGNPMGFSTGSPVFREDAGYSRDFSINDGGAYGFAYTGDFLATGIIVDEGFRTGSSMTFRRDTFEAALFFATAMVPEKETDDWVDEYPMVSISNPSHIGILFGFTAESFTLKTLMAVSGSSGYRSGSYFRNLITVSPGRYQFELLTAATTPDFITAEAEPVPEKYSVQLQGTSFVGSKWIFKFNSGIISAHPAVVPDEYTGMEGGTSLNTRYESHNFALYSEVGQDFEFLSNGDELIENFLETGGELKWPVAFEYRFDLVWDFEKLRERTGDLRIIFEGDSYYSYIFIRFHEQDTSPYRETAVSLRLDKDICRGSLFAGVKFQNTGYEDIAEGWEMESLSLGFSSRFAE